MKSDWKRVTVLVEPARYSELAALAEKSDRTVGAEIRQAIRAHVATVGKRS